MGRHHTLTDSKFKTIRNKYQTRTRPVRRRRKRRQSLRGVDIFFMARHFPASEQEAEHRFPRLVIFDLDYTLWPLDVDTNPTLPFEVRRGTVFDSRGIECPLYKDVRAVLKAVADGGAIIAFASRTHDGAAARALLEAHGLLHYLRGDERLLQAYPSGGRGKAKTQHFSQIKSAVGGISSRDIIFFDDMLDNIEQARKDGVCSVFLNRDDGLTCEDWLHALDEWRKQYDTWDGKT